LIIEVPFVCISKRCCYCWAEETIKRRNDWPKNKMLKDLHWPCRI